MGLGTYTISKKWRDLSSDERKKLRPQTPKNTANKWQLQDEFFGAVNNVITKWNATVADEDGKGNKAMGYAGIVNERENDFYGDLGLSVTCWAETRTEAFNNAPMRLDGKIWDKFKKLAEDEGLSVGRHTEDPNADPAVRNWVAIWAKNITEVDKEMTTVTYSGDSTDESAQGDATMGQDIVNGNGVLSAAYWAFNNIVDLHDIWSNIQGEKQFAGNEALFKTLQTLVSSSLRSFASTPEGGIRIWWPDRWDEGEGKLVKTVEISDLELVGLTAQTSMEGVYTHVYCRGGYGLEVQSKTSTSELSAWEQSTGLVFLGMKGLSDRDLELAKAKEEAAESKAVAASDSMKRKQELLSPILAYRSAQKTRAGAADYGAADKTAYTAKFLADVMESESSGESFDEFYRRKIEGEMGSGVADYIAEWNAAKATQSGTKAAVAGAAAAVEGMKQKDAANATDVINKGKSTVRDANLGDGFTAAIQAATSAIGGSVEETERSIVYRNWIHMEDLGMTLEQFYETYGMRPKVVNNPNVMYTSIQPFIIALDEFLSGFATIHRINLTVTFMPEVRPGMRVKLKSYDVSWYVKGVKHQMSYTGGFTSSLECICPTGTMLDAMVNISSTDDVLTITDYDFKTDEGEES